MNLRHLVVPALAAAFVLLPSTAALADPPGSTVPQTFGDNTGDAEPLVDMTQVHTYRTAADYRATIRYTKLGPANGLRYYVSFSPAASRRPAGIPSQGPNGNLVELRRTPGGQVKSLSFRTTNGEDAAPATCAGTRAVADLTNSKITFIIPNACWKGSSGAAFVDAGARRYPAGGFDNASNPPILTTDQTSDSLDEAGTWFYGNDG